MTNEYEFLFVSSRGITIIIRGEAGGCVWTDATGGIVATLVMRMRKNWSPGSCFSAVLHVHRNRSKGQGIFSRQDDWAISEITETYMGLLYFITRGAVPAFWEVVEGSSLGRRPRQARLCGPGAPHSHACPRSSRGPSPYFLPT